MKRFLLFTLVALLLLEVVNLDIVTSLSVDRSVELVIVAVSSTPNGTVGVYSFLETRVICPGEGHVYIETRPLTSLDTQASARIAAIVAARTAGIDFYSCDYLVSIVSNASSVGGPSASAAIAVGLASALLGLKPNKSVVMTGMINVDGTVGPVGGLVEKLEAAKEAGANVFLVPAGQIVYPRVVVERKRVGPMVIERSRLLYVNLSEYGAKLGVEVHEVSSIYEALKYFTGSSATRAPLNVSVEKIIPQEQVEAMKRWSTRLAEKAREMLKEYEELEDRLPPRIVESLKRFYNSSAELLRGVSGIEQPYIAATYAYRAMINATYLKLFAEAYTRGVESVVENITSFSAKKLDEYRILLGGYKPSDLYTFSVLVNIWSRIIEADMTLEELADNVKSGFCSYSPETCIYQAAMLYARTLSVEDWIGLLELRVVSPEISVLRIEEVTRLLLDAAQSELNYVQLLSSETGRTSVYVNSAANMLIRASSAEDLVEKLVYALKALMYASLSIHEAFTLDKHAAAEALRSTALLQLYELASRGAFVAANYLYVLLGDVHVEKGDVETALYLYEEASFLASLYTMLTAPPRTATALPTATTITSKTPRISVVTSTTIVTRKSTMTVTATVAITSSITKFTTVTTTVATTTPRFGVPLTLFGSVVAALVVLWFLSLVLMMKR
ncbi:MAG: hypothetical protein DRO12_01185 [Thermoprotei archaeon]|nr:MAG: hypothetical protein DRO12_01185 [Thermoprotei archaeon]